MIHVPRIPPKGPDGDDPSGDPAPREPRSPWGERAGPFTPPRPSDPPETPPGRPASHRPPPAREPAFMLPGPVVAMIALITVVHVARSTLSYFQDLQVLAWFAFIPARYSETFVQLPGGIAADVWTFVTYALLHGSWIHLITNSVWLVAFGAAVSRRFGGVRFWIFSAAAAAGGAGLHLLFHWGDAIPVVGASAAISGQMAAAARFVFDAGGPLRLRAAPGSGDEAFRRPARSLAATFRNRTAVAFIALWFIINLAVGLGSSAAGGMAIAWEAHLGGFLVGLLTFRFFDPVPR